MTKAGNGIVLDPHVAGSCVITLDEADATTLRDLLIEWQGRPCAGTCSRTKITARTRGC